MSDMTDAYVYCKLCCSQALYARKNTSVTIMTALRFNDYVRLLETTY